MNADSEDRIRGALKDSNESFTTVRVEDPGLLAELEQRGITVNGQLAANRWSELVGWLLPLILLVVFRSVTT
jgi:hypothetical protein